MNRRAYPTVAVAAKLVCLAAALSACTGAYTLAPPTGEDIGSPNLHADPNAVPAAVSTVWDLASADPNTLAYDPNVIDVGPQGASLGVPGTDASAVDFALGEAVGVVFDANSFILRLGDAGGCNGLQSNCFAELSATWCPAYANLAGYWPLDLTVDPNGGSTLAGTIGPTLTVQGSGVHATAGYIGRGLELTGSSGDGLRLSSSLLAGHSSMTFVAYVNWLGGDPNSHIFDLGGDSNLYVYVTPANANNVAAVGFSNSGQGSESMFQAAAPLQPRQWTHVAVTLDGATATLYLGGVQAAQQACAITPSSLSGGSSLFGLSRHVSDPNFSGTIDDLAVFNTALTASQIAALVAYPLNPPRGGTLVSRPLGPVRQAPWTGLSWSGSLPYGKALQTDDPNSYTGLPAAPLTSGLVLLWHFEEAAAAAGGAIADASGNINPGVAQGGITYGAAGVTGHGLLLDGQTAQVATLSPFTAPQLYTVSAWFRSLAGGEFISFGNSQTGTSSRYDRMIYMSDAGVLHFGIYDGSSQRKVVSTTLPYNDDSWHHVAGTLDASLTMSFYVDGAFIGSQTIAPPDVTFTGYWRVGGDSVNQWPNGPSDAHLAGYVDEVAVWSRALSPGEVQQLWRRGASQVGFQVRSCTQPSCADGGAWLGPDGTAATLFSEAQNTTPEQPALLFAQAAPSLPPLAGPYIQYRAQLSSLDEASSCTYAGQPGACSPELGRISMLPQTFSSGVSAIASTAGFAQPQLRAVTAQLGGAGCPGGVLVTLSVVGMPTWHYFDGSRWAPSDGSMAQANAPASLSADQLSLFAAQVGSGPITVRALLQSDGTTPCALSSITLD